MTSPAVPLAPTARLLRAVGGRRALQLVLLFGGLIALGLLCGGRAQAAGTSGTSDSGVPVVPSLRAAATGLPDASVEHDFRTAHQKPVQAKAVHTNAAHAHVVPTKAAHAHAVHGTAVREEAVDEETVGAADGADARAAGVPGKAARQEPVAPKDGLAGPAHSRSAVSSFAVPAVREAVVDSLNERVVRPLTDTVGTTMRTTVVTTVTTTVEIAVHQVVEQVAEQVAEQVVQRVGALVGEVREVGDEIVTAVVRPLPSEMPGLPGLPGLPTPSGPPGAGAGSQPPAASAGVGAVPATEPAHETSRHSRPADRAEVTAPAACGGVSGMSAHPQEGAPHTEARPAAPSVPGHPDGAPVANASMSDGGSTRHGDLHAAAFGSRVPVLLQPGATASGPAAPVADRLREIPEFPG
ncbi:hypothetical protein [Streptomyces sp. VRA16 Mangrove soil]|uniref:hypothetical protein n=1 Tax=Streptomyces sp. VRA16 Mangrove soil TaxID=2817434 RepID=UPI001A9E2CBA|nr:hypothetical protein [Streptomyces sp. VRA16 Mangrove soil]MBO1335137.1 hypothetical protein [Streptomyces sp. VRA16 Mangrove soil]